MHGSDETDALSNFNKEVRPWGEFERFTLNEATTVKIITVHADEEFSLQTHAARDEFWRIIQGSGTLTIGEKTIEATGGDAFYLSRGTKHRAMGGPAGLTARVIR